MARRAPSSSPPTSGRRSRSPRGSWTAHRPRAAAAAAPPPQRAGPARPAGVVSWLPPAGDYSAGSEERPRVPRGPEERPGFPGALPSVPGVKGALRGPLCSQNVEPGPRGEGVFLPEAGVGQPGQRLVAARRRQHRQGSRALEEAAEGETAGAARLDQRELRHVLVANRPLDDRRHARAVEHERHLLPRLHEVRERVRRVARPRAGQEVRILLHRGRDLRGLLQAIEHVDAAADGGGAAADHDARGAQALQALEMGAAMRLALGGVVLGGDDGQVEDDHAGEPTTRGTVVEVERFERFRAKFPFPLDDFQVEAIRAIEADQSVIVSAPTGSGKTLVAEYAIQCALETGRRIAYTTPLKALSNQKFNAFTRAYGPDKP